MGQGISAPAGNRRLRQSRQRLEDLRPRSLTCRHCKAEIPHVHTMDTTGMDGIEAAFAGVCGHCAETTWQFRGHPEAVALTRVAMDDSSRAS